MIDRYFTDPDGSYWVVQTENANDPVPVTFPDGAFEVNTPRPSVGYAWDGQAWAQDAAAVAAMQDAVRAETFISKGEFCIALKNAGVLSAAEAVATAKGDWAASFSSSLSNLSQSEKEDAEIIWASASNVYRAHPLIVLLTADAGLTEAQVDALFGLSFS